MQNLYIDESGSAYIAETKYRFFVLATIIMHDSEENNANAFLSAWRKKYLINSDQSFHAANFFEDLKNKKGQLIKSRIKKLTNIDKFQESVNELYNLICYLNFRARIYFIDLYQLQNALKLTTFINSNDHEFRQKLKRKFKGQTHYPLVALSERVYKFHESVLFPPNSKKSKKGYIYYESQKENDVNLILGFHKFTEANKNKRRYIYGDNILGINFYTKATLSAPIEIADLLAYSTTQHLRNKYSQKELSNFNNDRLSILLKMTSEMRSKYRIETVDMTTECSSELKKLASS